MTTNTVNTKAIAGFLDTAVDQIKSITEMACVYCVVVKGFRPIFVSKAKLAMYIADDAKKYNSGTYSHHYSTAYGKAYGACPLHNSPTAKANQAELEKLWALPAVPANHAAAAFFPSF
jgi:hypothetical protein